MWLSFAVKEGESVELFPLCYSDPFCCSLPLAWICGHKMRRMLQRQLEFPGLHSQFLLISSMLLDNFRCLNAVRVAVMRAKIKTTRRTDKSRLETNAACCMPVVSMGCAQYLRMPQKKKIIFQPLQLVRRVCLTVEKNIHTPSTR